MILDGSEDTKARGISKFVKPVIVTFNLGSLRLELRGVVLLE